MIILTNLYRKKHPVLSGVCEMINDALVDNPNMTLAEFASILDEEVMAKTSEYLTEIIKKQMADRNNG